MFRNCLCVFDFDRTLTSFPGKNTNCNNVSQFYSGHPDCAWKNTQKNINDHTLNWSEGSSNC